MLHLAVAAHAQRVVPGVVGAFPHQEQACLWWAQEPLCLLPRDLAMEPAAGRPGLGSWWPKGTARLHFPKALPLAGTSPQFRAQTGSGGPHPLPPALLSSALLAPSSPLRSSTQALPLVSKGPHGHPSPLLSPPCFPDSLLGVTGRPVLLPPRLGIPNRSSEVLTA